MDNETKDKKLNIQYGRRKSSSTEESISKSEKIKQLSAESYESNDSLKRQKKRSQLNKLKKKKKKKTPDLSQSFDTDSKVKFVEGHLEIIKEGHGYLRRQEHNFLAQPNDVLISQSIISDLGLRTGLIVKAEAHNKKNSEQLIVSKLLEIENKVTENYSDTHHFQNLTSINPFECYHLATKNDTDTSMRLLEILTPIGKGQRSLIVAPPRSGKTMLVEKIINGINTNHSEAEVFLLLIDERPEEVTHLSRLIKAKIFSSCLDRSIEEHVSLSKMVIEIAMRQAEKGKDIVIVLDSITRMARAFNNQLKSSGRTLSGGVDAQALQDPKKFFGAARKLEEGGSLTIIATALIQTGSQMDEVIFQEFKGTGNMELVLNRKLAEKRIWPAIDVNMSGTRREELIMPQNYYKASIKIRRYLSSINSEINQTQAVIQAMKKFDTTQEFVSHFLTSEAKIS